MIQLRNRAKDPAGESVKGTPERTPQVAPEAIRGQLERILGSAAFRNSRRHSAFLRYVVEELLAGNESQLKERVIGVHVFNLDPGYDTSSNPVVRVSAGELRKRLAQYYHGEGTEGELRVELPAGSYVPEFRPVAAPAALPQAVAAPLASRRLYRVAGALAVALLIAIAWWRPWAPQTAFALFWEPVWNSPGQVVISVPVRQPHDVEPTRSPGPGRVALADMVAVAKLTPVLKARGKDFRIMDHGLTTQADLKSGPVLLIGAFSNQMSLRLMREARFAFEREPGTDLLWIKDRQNPTNRQWQLKGSMIDETSSYTDYAMISRILDPTTDQIAVVAAGISSFGTLAAGELLSSPEHMGTIPKDTLRDWGSKNVQVVIEVQVTGMKPGQPRVLASYSW